MPKLAEGERWHVVATMWRRCAWPCHPQVRGCTGSSRLKKSLGGRATYVLGRKDPAEDGRTTLSTGRWTNGAAAENSSGLGWPLNPL